MAPPERSIEDNFTRKSKVFSASVDSSPNFSRHDFCVSGVPQEPVGFSCCFEGCQPLFPYKSVQKQDYMLDGTFKSLRSDHLNGTLKVSTTSLGVEEMNGDHGDISSVTTTEESPIEKEHCVEAQKQMEATNNPDSTVSTVSANDTANSYLVVNAVEHKLEERRKKEAAEYYAEKRIKQMFKIKLCSKQMNGSCAESVSLERIAHEMNNSTDCLLGSTYDEARKPQDFKEAVTSSTVGPSLTCDEFSKAALLGDFMKRSNLLPYDIVVTVISGSKDSVDYADGCSREKGLQGLLCHAKRPLDKPEGKIKTFPDQCTYCDAGKQCSEIKPAGEKQVDCMEKQDKYPHEKRKKQGICSTDKKKKDSITPGMQKKYPTLDKQELFKGDPGGSEPLDSEQSNSSSSSGSSSKSEGGDGSGSSHRRSKRKKASQNPHGHQGGTDESEDDDDGRTPRPPGQQNPRKDLRVFLNIEKDKEQAPLKMVKLLASHQNSVSPPEALRNQSADQPRSQYNSKPPPPRPQPRNSSGVIEGSEPDSIDASAVESDHEVQHKQCKRIRDTGYQSIPTGLLHIAGQDDEDTNAVGAQCPTYETLVGLRSPVPPPRDNEGQNVTPNLAVQDNNVSEGSESLPELAPARAPAPPVVVERPIQDQYPHVMVADYDGANQQDLYERPVEESRDQAVELTEMVVYRPYLPPVRDPRPSHLRPLAPVLEDSLTFSKPVTFNNYVGADHSDVLFIMELVEAENMHIMNNNDTI